SFRALHFLLAAILPASLMSCNYVGRSNGGLEPVGSNLHEFVKFRQGDVLSHEFQLVNRARTPLKLVDIVSSCGCLVAPNEANLGNESIPPNGTIAIPVQMTISGYERVATASIKITYSAELASNSDAPRSYKELRLLVRA